MATERIAGRTTGAERRMSDFAPSANGREIKAILRTDPGQNCPDHYPHGVESLGDPLGEPMPIRAVARVLGCSPWTVRQRYLPQGLPHFRSGPQGKLVFFRHQVIRWIVERQQKGARR